MEYKTCTCDWISLQFFHNRVTFLWCCIIVNIVIHRYFVASILSAINLLNYFDIQTFLETLYPTKQMRYLVITWLGFLHMKQCIILGVLKWSRYYVTLYFYLRLFWIIHWVHFSFTTNKSVKFGNANHFLVIFISHFIQCFCTTGKYSSNLK